MKSNNKACDYKFKYETVEENRSGTTIFLKRSKNSIRNDSNKEPKRGKCVCRKNRGLHVIFPLQAYSFRISEVILIPKGFA